MKWSKYQLALFDAVKELRDQRSGAIVVKAVPGSGKSTTSVEAVKLIHPGQSAVFLAFNKSIAEKLKEKVPSNCEAATVNSFGFRALRGTVRGAQLDDRKTHNALREFVADPELRRRWDGAMKRLIGLKKATLQSAKAHVMGCLNEDQVGGLCTCPSTYLPMSTDELARKFDLDLPTDSMFLASAELVWGRVTSQTLIIDFDDQWFLPVYKKFHLPKYDWCFIDEAQDLSSTQIELVKRIAPRIVAVGDPRQSIYGFRGADSEAMERLEKLLSARVMPLSICYRCPKSVIVEVNKVFASDDGTVPNIVEASEDAVEGVVDTVDAKHLKDEAASGSWVLCRTTAPLIKMCLSFIIDGKRAFVKGRDVGQQLTSLIEKVGGYDIVEFTIRLEEWYFAEKQRLEAAERDVQLQALEDRVESIYALCEGQRNVDGVINKIRQMFTDDSDQNGVTFATAHRAKGLEADDVYILCPESMPFPKAKSEWAKEQEKNIKYVALSRAMKRLRWVKGKV